MKLVRNITVGHTERLRKPVLLTILSNLVNIVPFCLSIEAVNIIFKSFDGTGTPLDISKPWFIVAILFVYMAVMAVAERAAYRANFRGAYEMSATGRVSLAEHLMQRISMVFQDVYMFQDTIRNNIRFGKAGATDDEIIEAAKKACCHDFIMRLPCGYDTMVGEGGCTLSGGEKQRLSIARAILKDAPVVLLDEATASLDPENEVEVQKAINTLIGGRTVIVIAHKLRTIKNADKIVVLDNGRVSEEGTHDTLIGNNGLYRKLWNIQEQSAGWSIYK